MARGGTGWITLNDWIKHRMRLYVAAGLFVIVFMAVLMYLTWGSDDYSNYYMCVSYITAPIVVIWVVIVLLIRSAWRAPVLLTVRPMEETITRVGSVLERHGIEWFQFPLTRYMLQEGDEQALRDIKARGPGPEPYVVSFESGRVFLKQDPTATTAITVNPDGALNPQVMKDIEEALS